MTATSKLFELTGKVAAVFGGSSGIVGLLAGPTVGGAITFVVGLAVLFAGLLLLGGSQVVERRAAALATKS